MSIRRKSYLIAFFVIAVVDQISTSSPDILDDIKIKSSTGTKYYGFAAGNDSTPKTTTAESPTSTTPGGPTTSTTENPTTTTPAGPTTSTTENPTTTTKGPTTTTKGPTTTTEKPVPSYQFIQFTLQSTGSKIYNVSDAVMEHGKWWLGLPSIEVPEFYVNTLAFGNSPLVLGGVKGLGSSDGVKGTFKIRNRIDGLVAMVVNFETKGKEPPYISLSNPTSCYGGVVGEPNICSIKCD